MIIEDHGMKELLSLSCVTQNNGKKVQGRNHTICLDRIG